MHCHRVMLHERITGYICHSHTLRCVIIQHPIGRERVLSLLGRVSSLDRTVAVIYQARSLRNDRSHVAVNAGRLTQLGVIHLLGHMIIQNVLQFVVGLGSPLRPKWFYRSWLTKYGLIKTSGREPKNRICFLRNYFMKIIDERKYFYEIFYMEMYFLVLFFLTHSWKLYI